MLKRARGAPEPRGGNFCSKSRLGNQSHIFHLYDPWSIDPLVPAIPRCDRSIDRVAIKFVLSRSSVFTVQFTSSSVTGLFLSSLLLSLSFLAGFLASYTLFCFGARVYPHSFHGPTEPIVLLRIHHVSGQVGLWPSRTSFQRSNVLSSAVVEARNSIRWRS